MSDGRAIGHATNPPPRASWWHERRGLLASGLHSPSRFPSGVEWRAWPRGPGTRYSGGAAPVLHRLPSIPVRVRLFCSASLPAQTPGRKRGRERMAYQPPPTRATASPPTSAASNQGGPLCFPGNTRRSLPADLTVPLQRRNERFWISWLSAGAIPGAITLTAGSSTRTLSGSPARSSGSSTVSRSEGT